MALHPCTCLTQQWGCVAQHNVILPKQVPLTGCISWCCFGQPLKMHRVNNATALCMFEILCHAQPLDYKCQTTALKHNLELDAEPLERAGVFTLQPRFIPICQMRRSCCRPNVMGTLHCNQAARSSGQTCIYATSPVCSASRAAPICCITKPCNLALQRRAPGNQWMPSADA